MDELQHWLADARYSQSLMEGSHKPMKLIPLPPEVWDDKKEFISALDWNVKTILSQPLGRYFMQRFIEDEMPDQMWLHTFLSLCIRLEDDDKKDPFSFTFRSSDQSYPTVPVASRITLPMIP